MKNSKKHSHNEYRSQEEKTKEILIISPKENDEEQRVKVYYKNDADWLSSISTDYQIKWNGENRLKIKTIFLAVINIRLLLNIGRDGQ